MTDYEVWGPDDDGQNALLDRRSGPVPKPGDTVEVRGKERVVKRVTEHHGPNGTTKRVQVGPEDEGDPMPIAVS